MSTSTTTTPTTFYSGTFNPDLGRLSDPGSPIFFNQSVWWLGNGHHKTLYLYQGQMGPLLKGDTSQVEKNWSTQKVSSKIQSNGLKLETSKMTGSCIQKERCYFFWRDTYKNRLACMYLFVSYDAESTALNTNYCDSAIKIQQNGSTLSNLDGDLSVVSLGDRLLVTFLASDNLYSAVLNPADLDSDNNTWEVEHLNNVSSLKDLGLKGGSNLSADWFSFGPNQNYLMVSILDGHNASPFIWKINDNSYISGSPVKTISPFTAKYTPTLRRDPAGRILAVYPKNDSKQYIYTRIYSTLGSSTTGEEPQFSDSFGGETKLFDSSHKGDTKSSTSFIIANAVDNPVTVFNKDNTTQTYSGQTAEVYQFEVHGHSDKSDGAYKVRLQIGTYGQLGIAPNYASRSPKSSEQSKILVKSIIDPFPMANDMVDSSNYASKRVLTRYGVSESQSEERTLALSMQFGVKGNFTTKKGLGPAMEYQFKTGPSFRNEYGITTTQETFFESFAGADPQATGNYNIVPYGEMVGLTLPTVHEDAQFFFDAEGRQVNGYGSALYSSLRIDPKDSNTHIKEAAYHVVSSTPGNLNSYTKDSINDNMKAAFDQLTDPDQRSWFPAAYGNGTYFQDVILPNAYAFDETSNSDPEKGKYLEYLIGHGSSSQEYNAMTRSFTEWGWTMDGSFYLGISGGEEFSVMGVGEGFEAQDMVGFEFQSAAALDYVQEHSWGIHININDLIPYNNPYTVRLYLLKPNELWAKEAYCFPSNKSTLRDNADLLNSKPMKIFFRVIID